MSVKKFMEEEHPSMFVSADGKIGRINGVSIIRTHVYPKVAPRFIPDRLWWVIIDMVTETISESEEL